MDKKDNEYLGKIGLINKKLKIIDKYGVNYILHNYKDISDKFKLFNKSYLLSIILFYRKKEFIEFFNKFEIIDIEDKLFLYDILCSNYFVSNMVIKSINKVTLNCLISTEKYNCDIINDIYRIRLNDCYSLLDESIYNNTYHTYISYVTPEYIRKYVVDRINKNELYYNIIGDYSSILNESILKYRLDDLLDSLNNINVKINDLDNINHYSNIPDIVLDYILNRLGFSSDMLNYIYRKCYNDLKEYVYNKYTSTVNKWLDELIRNNSYKEVLDYRVPYINKYIINNLSNDELNNILEDKYTLKKVCEYRLDDIINIMINNINKNTYNLENYLKLDISIIRDNLIPKLNLNDETFLFILSTGNYKVLELLYNNYKSRVEDVINNDTDMTKYLLSIRYPIGIKVLAIKNIKDNQVIGHFNNRKYDSKVTNLIFKIHKDIIVDYYNNLLNIDLDKFIDDFKSSSSKCFRKYYLDILDIDILYSLLDNLNHEEIDYIFNNNGDKFISKLTREYNKDPYEYINKYIVYSYNKVSNLSLDFITYDDIIMSIIKGLEFTFYLEKNSEFKKLMKRSVGSKANDIKNSIYVLDFIKNIRYNYDELFTIFINNIEDDKEFIHRLFIEKCLSDKQKELLYSIKKYEILEIVNNNLSNYLVDPLIYIQKGTPNEVLDLVLSFISKDRIRELMSDDNFINRKSIGVKFATKLILNVLIDENERLIVDELVKNYKKDTLELLRNYDIIKYFLKRNNINIVKFWQYSLNSNYDFVSDIRYITLDNIDLFLKVKDIMYKEIYLSENEYSNHNFLDFIKNYVRYKDLCVSILNSNNDVNYNNIRLLFKQDILINDINDYNKCNNIIDIIKNDYIYKYEECIDLVDYKNLLLQILFKVNIRDAYNYLHIYGNTKDLIQLKLYNLNNIEVLNKIDNVIKYTDLLEIIIYNDDLDSIKNTLNNLLNNIESVLIDNNYCNYEELMREMYELEMNENLTKVGINTNKEDVLINSDFTGDVEVYDFRDKKYILLAHVMSKKEELEDLINGNSNGKSNFISLSSISNRMQSYYYNGINIIFGYDEMPKDNFVISSSRNMGTNYNVEANNTEVSNINRNQRGVLEISDTKTNSEILAIREGLKPKYIICPGRIPNSNEINIAKKYNLKIVLTQPMKKSINSPKDISNKEKRLSKDYLVNLSNELISKNNQDKIAIITDIHGLFEPTISVLEDIRKKGITKIYSLGDNIGTGSNSKEVLDLLKHYNVESIKGNHELYIINGVNSYIEHFNRTGGYNEEVINTLWTKNSLDKGQLEDINNYKDFIELNINGKKVLLCHYLYDYNTNKLLFNTNDYDLIICGHTHFKKEINNIITLKGLGIGNTSLNNGTATYMILSEYNNELVYEYVDVDYSYKNTINSLNESDNNFKDKMISWIRK